MVKMRVWVVASLVTLVCSGPVGSEEEPKKQPAPVPLEERVNKAIARGVRWLKARQAKDGSWGPCVSGGRAYDGSAVKDPSCHTSGPTSFAMFTLLRCGVERKDPVIRRGAKWLRKYVKNALLTEQAPDGNSFTSYELSSLILMLTAMYDTGKLSKPAKKPAYKPKGSPFTKADWTWLHQCVESLLGRKRSTNRQFSDGSFGYNSWNDDGDVSATQFALLALRAAVRAGYPLDKVDRDVWRNAQAYLMRVQDASGGSPYKDGEESTLGMTAAAASSMLIIREQRTARGEKPGKRLDARIDMSLKWIGERYGFEKASLDIQLRRVKYHHCMMYAVERTGILDRRVTLGGKDWYRLGAEFLLEQQRNEGYWSDNTCMEPKLVLGTCFALLFLKRSTRPPVITHTAR